MLICIFKSRSTVVAKEQLDIILWFVVGKILLIDIGAQCADTSNRLPFNTVKKHFPKK